MRIFSYKNNRNECAHPCTYSNYEPVCVVTEQTNDRTNWTRILKAYDKKRKERRRKKNWYEYDTISIKRITPRRHTNHNQNHKNQNKLNKERRWSTLTSFCVRNDTTRWMRYTLNVLWFFFAAFVVIIILSSWLLSPKRWAHPDCMAWHGMAWCDVARIVISEPYTRYATARYGGNSKVKQSTEPFNTALPFIISLPEASSSNCKTNHSDITVFLVWTNRKMGCTWRNGVICCNTVHRKNRC